MANSTLDPILEGRRSQPHQLIELLHDVQESQGYLSEGAMKTISQVLGVPLIEVYRVAHFYKAFSLKPRGKNVVTICMGTACHVRGSNLLLDQAKAQLAVAPGDTTEDGQFTLEAVNCLGACALGPIVVHNGSYRNHMDPGALRKTINKAHGEKETNDETN